MAARRYSRRSGRRLRTTGTAAWRRSGGTMTLRKRRRPSAVGKGKKRRALPLTRRSYKRARGKATVSQATEYSRFITRMGRYGRKTVKQAFKELRAGQSKVIYSHRNFGNLSGGQIFALNSTVDDTRYCPLFLYDLTCCRARRTTVNDVNEGQTTVYDLDSYPMLRMKMQSSTGAVAFDPINGLSHHNTYMPELQVETDTGNANGLMLGPNSLLKYYNIKMNLFGTTSHVTKWCIQLVQLRDDELDPWTSSSTFKIGNKYAGFWQSLVKPYMNNPIADQGTAQVKDLRVIKSWTFIQDAQTTIDKDVAPKVKEFRCFVKRNMLCKWDNATVPAEATAPMVADSAGYIKSRNARMNSYLDLKKRTFLLIRAMNIGTDAEPTVDNTPSFDYNIKTCHVRINT